MKRIGLLLLAVISIIMLAGCGQTNKYRSISYDKFKKMTAAKESFILYIGSSSCSACTLYSQYLNDVLSDYDVEVNYLDISTMSDEEHNEFTATINYGGTTPTTIYIVDGEEKNTYDRIRSAEDYDHIVESFRKNGYIE